MEEKRKRGGGVGGRARQSKADWQNPFLGDNMRNSSSSRNTNNNKEILGDGGERGRTRSCGDSYTREHCLKIRAGNKGSCSRLMWPRKAAIAQSADKSRAWRMLLSLCQGRGRGQELKG